MKTSFVRLLGLMAVMACHPLFVQGEDTSKKDTLTVYGNCGQCKERIEEAAYIRGVKKANWDKYAHVLTVEYKTDKTSLDKISKAVAKVGYDTRLHKASDKNYEKLPACCHYRTTTDVAHDKD